VRDEEQGGHRWERVRGKHSRRCAPATGGVPMPKMRCIDRKVRAESRSSEQTNLGSSTCHGLPCGFAVITNRNPHSRRTGGIFCIGPPTAGRICLKTAFEKCQLHKWCAVWGHTRAMASAIHKSPSVRMVSAAWPMSFSNCWSTQANMSLVSESMRVTDLMRVFPKRSTVVNKPNLYPYLLVLKVLSYTTSLFALRATEASSSFMDQYAACRTPAHVPQAWQ
jgi:hypothetical protein